MKRFLIAVVIAVFVAGSHLAYSAAADDTPGKKEQAEKSDKNMEERLKMVGRQLDQLQVVVSKKAQQIEKDLKRSVQDAKKKNKDVSAKLEQAMKESVSAWKKFSTEFSEEVNKIEKALDNALSDSKDSSGSKDNGEPQKHQAE